MIFARHRKNMSPKPELLSEKLNIQKTSTETITLYLRRKNVCWTKLKKEKIDYPDKAKGYITLRDAHLSEKRGERWRHGDKATTPLRQLLLI